MIRESNYKKIMNALALDLDKELPQDVLDKLEEVN